jgi:DnaJ-class molecular chaperone
MNADPRGYYAALHLTPAATQTDIQRAFRTLIRVHHPDVGPSGAGTTASGAQSGGEDVRTILDAFAVLRNPLSRAEYDREGRTSAAPGTGTGTTDTGGTGATAAAPRDIPVHHRRRQGPALRVTPVRWERGPWEGRS